MTLRNGGCLVLPVVLLFALVWTALTLTFDAAFSFALWQQARSLNFATTQGTVLDSQVDVELRGRKSTYNAQVRYAYQVRGEHYEGTRVRVVQLGGGVGAEHMVAEFQPGQHVSVYYDPDQPGEAVLMPGLLMGDVLITIFLVPFNMVMLGVWTAIGYMLRMSLPGKLPPYTRVFDGAEGQVVRVPGADPAVAAMIAMGGTAFVLVFVLVFGFAMQGPVWPAIVAWAIILAAGVTSAWWTWREQRSGLYDLIIDDSLQRVAPPRLRTELDPPAWIAIADLERTEVFAETITDSDGHRKQYITRLVARDRRRHKIHTWMWEGDARRFAVWLAKRLGLAPPK